MTGLQIVVVGCSCRKEAAPVLFSAEQISENGVFRPDSHY
jgi:hypothetical protein